MQVFVPYSDPLSVAKCLDKRRLNKQIIECRQIIKAICGESSAWKNHPVVKMYSKHVVWLTLYTMCLDAWRHSDEIRARKCSSLAMKYTPLFLSGFQGVRLQNWHRGRLCEKDIEHYEKYFTNMLRFARFGENVYIVDGKTLWYKDGKLVRVGMFAEDFYGVMTWICNKQMEGYF